jgi:hypothetical protein
MIGNPPKEKTSRWIHYQRSTPVYPFGMPKTPFNPRKGKYLPLGPEDVEGEDPAKFMALGCYLDATKKKATVNAGYVQHLGISEYAYAGGEITLTGATCIVYLEFVRSTHVFTLKTSATRPTMASETLVNIVLRTFTADGGKYAAGFIERAGNEVADAPIA